MTVKSTIWDRADSYWHLDLIGTRPWAAEPTGITVHYTADGSLEQAQNSMTDKSLGYHLGYHFLVDRQGLVHQTASLGKAVNHAGNAAWNGQSPNRSHLAIAIVNWGLLEKGKAWTGAAVVGGVMKGGHEWEPATRVQEAALYRLIEELRAEFRIDIKDVCGHDECCIPKGRKIDPGGTLGRALSDYRKAGAI